MRYFEFLSTPVKASSIVFLVEYNSEERMKILNAKFQFEKFGEIDNIKVKLKGYEGITEIEFLPYLNWNLNVPDRANICVISLELKKIIQKFKMLPNKWFNVEVYMHELFSHHNDIKNYAMLQISGDITTNLNFNESKFGISDWYTDIIIPYEAQDITKLNYSELQKEEFKNNKTIVPLKLEYTQNKDIIIGHRGIIFNEKVKQAIESAGFGPHNGLDFKEFTDYQIIMPGE